MVVMEASVAQTKAKANLLRRRGGAAPPPPAGVVVPAAGEGRRSGISVPSAPWGAMTMLARSLSLDLSSSCLQGLLLDMLIIINYTVVVDDDDNEHLIS
jgi:hypothetical protein